MKENILTIIIFVLVFAFIILFYPSVKEIDDKGNEHCSNIVGMDMVCFEY